MSALATETTAGVHLKQSVSVCEAAAYFSVKVWIPPGEANLNE